ncbi:MAG TPA: TadE family protein [Pirellulales bacterium]|nr:TadE family protein [Pirellulales bacterium]
MKDERGQNRRGLAPLEFVLCMPVLLFVLALMVDAGSKSCWKLRGLTAARDAAWRTRYPRTAGVLRNHIDWPSPATMNAAGAGPNGNLNSQELNQPVVRGPNLGTITVNGQLLDPSRGGLAGNSQRLWKPPLLPKLGASSMNQRHPLVDGKWQHPQMGIPATYSRRIPYIYTLPTTDASLKTAYLNAVNAIRFASFRPAFNVLDRDEEIRAWYGSYHNFYPQVSFCDANLDRVANNQQLAVIRAIQGNLKPSPRNGMPGRLARFWIGMYRSQLAQLQASGGNAALQTQLQSQIALLEGYLNQLPQ